ncbi:RNA polymerase sigma factor [uncultured Ruegeria sp.]|uniref:RNA polymerase sigma factor n=1 Tax=uncultured Ruegeria sp. TaxID=259304 RepID=UPI0026148CDA|nr:RNA polymerase sigma factor [uncultured Ruegeria sp.]
MRLLKGFVVSTKLYVGNLTSSCTKKTELRMMGNQSQRASSMAIFCGICPRKYQTNDLAGCRALSFASHTNISDYFCFWAILDSVVSTLMKKELISLLPRLRRFACSLTRSVNEADDLVQEACLRALSRCDQWDTSKPLDRWMFRITKNIWISEIRKRKVRLGQGHIAAEESEELVQSDTGEDKLVAAQLLGRISSLPPELASVLVAVSVEGYTYSEASELLGIPIGTVMSRMHRARKTLAEQISLSAGCE